MTETKLKTSITIKTKLALSILLGTALSLGVFQFAIMYTSLEKLNAKSKLPSGVVKNTNIVSGHVSDVVSGQSLSNIEISFTNTDNPSEIYKTSVNGDGDYQLAIGNAGNYNIKVNYLGESYYDYKQDYFQINTFPFIYNSELLEYQSYNLAENWNCSDNFEIATGDFPLISYLNRYYELIDIYLNNGTFSQEEWDEIKAIKTGGANSIEAELIEINSNPTNSLYVNQNYASVLLDNILCNSRKEIAFVYALEDNDAWSEIPSGFDPYAFVNTYLPGINENSLLYTINNLLVNNQELVGQELIDSQVVEKIAYIFDWQLEHSSAEGSKFSTARPWEFWRNYAENLSYENLSWVHPGGALFPNTQRRMMLFYTDGIENIMQILIHLAEYGDTETMANLYIDNNIFNKDFQFMTLPAIEDSTMPGYRTHIINRTLDLLNVVYPYVLKNPDVQDIIRWNEINKNQGSGFWRYLATDKAFLKHDQEMLEISQLFNNFCENTDSVNNFCSPIQPYYCSNNNIIKNCSLCGCSGGIECNRDGSCGIELPTEDF